jgi:hypothetical protein
MRIEDLFASKAFLPPLAGTVSFAVVRKLAQPLSTAEAARIADFAKANLGRPYDARANILMAEPRWRRLDAVASRCFPLGALLGRSHKRCAVT